MDVALYPAHRGWGKTTMVMQQAQQRAAEGQSVAIVSHSQRVSDRTMTYTPDLRTLSTIEATRPDTEVYDGVDL